MWYRSDSPETAEPVQERRDGEAQPVARPRWIRPACGRDETGDVRLLLDHLAAVVAADVTRDVLHAGDHQGRSSDWRAASAGGAPGCAKSSRSARVLDANRAVLEPAHHG